MTLSMRRSQLTLLLIGAAFAAASLLIPWTVYAQSDGQDKSDTPANSPATGQPTINGRLFVGQGLTADGSGITDENGMEDVVFGYQWIRSDWNTDSDIDDATLPTYTPVPDDVGKNIKVRVSFTDDVGNMEELTSEPTWAVALPEAGAYNQQASQPTKGLQTNLYHWQDGEYDRLLYLVRMDYTSDPPAPVFRRSPDGPDMVLPGGVTLILGNSWTDVNARRLFEKHKVPHNRVEKLPNMNGAYYIHTEPVIPLP